MKTIESSELNQLIKNQNTIHVLDVLADEQFERYHLPQAVNACVYESAFLDKVKELIPDHLAEIVIYGLEDNFGAAKLAAKKLEDSGWVNVSVLHGGLNGWINDGYGLVERKGIEENQHNGAFEIDVAKSVVRWTGRNLFNEHRGTIRLSSGKVTFDYGKLAGGKVTLDMSSIRCIDIRDKSMNQMLVNHLLSSDFFDTARFPKATFTIVSSKPILHARPGEPNFEIDGSFNMRGHSDEVLMEAAVGWDDEKIGIQSHFDIDRVIWGSTYGSGKIYESLGKHLVNDAVTIGFQLIAPS